MLYHVDSEQVAAAAGRAQASGEAIRAEVAGMIAQLEGLQASWGGAASHAFAGLLAEWRAAQVQMEAALAGIATALTGAAQEYTFAEQSAARLFHR